MMVTEWFWLDPVVSLAIVGVVVYGTWGFLRESMELALNAVAAHIDVAEIDVYLRALPGITDIHDLHVWGMSTTERPLTVHLLVPEGYPGDAFMDEVTRTVDTRFKIHRSTLQIEQGTTSHTCRLQPE